LLKILIEFFIGVDLMDNNYSFFMARMRYNELKDKLDKKFVRDILEAEIIDISDKETYMNVLKHIKVELPNLIGFCMESFFVGKCNEDEDVLHKSIKIATNNPRAQLNYAKNYVAIGTGLLSTRMSFHKYYDRHDKMFDVKFLKYNLKNQKIQPAMMGDKSSYAGLQLKAITSGEKYNIIHPLLKGDYANVITFLWNKKSGLHTKDECYKIIKEMKEYKKYNLDDKKYPMNKQIRRQLMNSIFSPEDVGICQDEVDEYVEYIVYCYLNGKYEMFCDFGYHLENGLILLKQALNGYRTKPVIEFAPM
jgi:hypothetical protein